MTENRTAIAGRRIPLIAWLLFGLAVIAGYAVLGGHRSHAAAMLPYLFLLACPLMHVFHRHGHGSHEGASSQSAPASPAAPGRLPTGDVAGKH